MKDGTLRQASKVLSLFEETPGDQIQVLLDSGLLADLRDGNISEVKRDEFRQLLGLRPFNSPLLEPIGTVNVATTGRFVARKKFALNTSANIRYIGNNFSMWFSDKVEEPPSGSVTLRYAKLLGSVVDELIMNELGDSKETALAQVYALIERQEDGKSGMLLTNGWANIFYVKDATGNLRVVLVLWYGDGWSVGAYPIAYPDGWDDGCQVFSRNS